MKKSGAVVVTVSLLLAGGVVGNYHRNAHLDRDLMDRPYESLSDGDLAALTAAYAGERDKIRGLTGANQADPTRVMNGLAPADFSGKLGAFDRFQRRNQKLTEIYRKALDQEVMVEALEREKSIRARGLDDEWTRILRRITAL